MSEHWQPAVSGLHIAEHGVPLAEVAADTRAVAAKVTSRGVSGLPVVTPIYQASTYRMRSVDHYCQVEKESGYVYARVGNPTVENAEAVISSLEEGAGTLVFSSGSAAVTTALLAVLRAGDHVVACKSVYSGTHSFLTKCLPKYHVDITWVDGTSADAYKKAIQENTKILYGETPCNPLISILDLEAFGRLGQSLDGIVTMVDATFGTPYLQQPIKYGIDYVIHSASKYLGGHSDLLAGVISARTLDQLRELYVWRTNLGCVLSPSDAALLARGVRTLPVRMDRHSQNAQQCAEFLAAHPKVERVYYPGLPQHPGHQVARRQMSGFSGMISFEMKGGLEPARRMVESVRLIGLAVSLGGTESLIEHPATMTHGPGFMDDAARKEAFITDGLIRISVGLENSADLIKDLRQALDNV